MPRPGQLALYVCSAVIAGALYGLMVSSLVSGVVFAALWGIWFSLAFQRWGVPRIEAKRQQRERDH